MKLVKWYNGKPGLFNDNWSNFFNDDFAKPSSASSPAVNVRETETGYELELAGPRTEKKMILR